MGDPLRTRWLRLDWPCPLTTPALLPSQDFGAEGSPPPLGRLLPKVQEVARCLGELLAAACAGRVSAPAQPVPTGSRPSSVPAPPLSWRLSRGGPGLPDLPDGALLQALPSSSSSLAPPGPALAQGWQQQTILMLKEQNRLLTQVRCWKVAG